VGSRDEADLIIRAQEPCKDTMPLEEWFNNIEEKELKKDVLV